MKLNQFADVLVFKKALNMHHKTTLMGRNEKKTYKFELIGKFSWEPFSTKSIKYKHFRCNFEDKNGQAKEIIINYNQL